MNMMYTHYIQMVHKENMQSSYQMQNKTLTNIPTWKGNFQLAKSHIENE